MKNTSLRFILPTAAALTLLAACATYSAKTVGVGSSFKGPVGLQLYSLRADFTKTVPPTLETVKNFGFKYVELAGTYNLAPEKFKELLDANGLTPISGHFPFDRYKTDPEGIAKDAKALGLKYAGCAWITHTGEFNEAAARNAIAVFNNAGAVLAKHGIKFFYHTHGYEFRPLFAGGTFFDLIVKETKPELVAFQMDVFWVAHPGQDPAKMLAKYPGRWELLHLKDMKKGLKGDFTGKSDVSNDVALGTGQLDWPAILKAAKKAGVKWYFIEDEAPTVKEQIPVSLRYLENVQF